MNDHCLKVLVLALADTQPGQRKDSLFVGYGFEVASRLQESAPNIPLALTLVSLPAYTLPKESRVLAVT